MGKTNLDKSNLQKLLECYLQVQSTAASSQSHLDEDSLNSFVEGRLNRIESANIINHLTRCSFCLHITAELMRFDSEFAAEKMPEPVAVRQPEKISEVLSGLLSRIFGTTDGAVFAHQEEKDQSAQPDEKSDDK